MRKYCCRFTGTIYNLTTVILEAGLPGSLIGTPQTYLVVFVNQFKFIIDASSSVKAKNFIHSQNFAKNISNTFDLRHGDVRVGVLTYSSTVHDHQDIELGDPINGADDLNARIDAMPYEHGDTHTGAALR